MDRREKKSSLITPILDGNIEEHFIRLYTQRGKESNSRKQISLPTFDEDASISDDDSVQSAVSLTGNKFIQSKAEPPRTVRPRLTTGSSFRAPLNPNMKLPSFRHNDNGELFFQKITVRNKSKSFPMSRGINRVIEPFRSFTSSIRIGRSTRSNLDKELDISSVGSVSVQKKQFMVKVERERNACKRILKLSTLTPDEYCYSPNQLVLSYVNWTFRISIVIIMISFTLVFFVTCILFALFLKIAADAHPECIIIGGKEYGTQTSTMFSGAFHLSWTTFTTVGYGAVFPSTGNLHVNQDECTFITLLCSLESFCGMIYVGFCTAFLLGRFRRVRSHAQVSFSNCICIQYGSPFDGAYNPNFNKGDSNRRTRPIDTTKKNSKLLCPVLKFQVINDLANVPGGDIFDARMNVVGRRETNHSTGATATSRHVRVSLQDSGHPFFTQVWHVTHVLNNNSSLLSKETRAAISDNGGFWPAHIVTHESLMKALVFDKIMITITGKCDLSATNVQITKKYSIDNVMIGYDYAPMLYKEQETGKTKVDMDLKHDIVEQDGGPDEDENNLNRDSLCFEARGDVFQDDKAS